MINEKVVNNKYDFYQWYDECNDDLCAVSITLFLDNINDYIGPIYLQAIDFTNLIDLS